MSQSIDLATWTQVLEKITPCSTEFVAMLSDIDRWSSEFVLEKGVNNGAVLDEVSSIVAQTVRGFIAHHNLDDVHYTVACIKEEKGVTLVMTFYIDNDMEFTVSKEYPIAVPL